MDRLEKLRLLKRAFNLTLKDAVNIVDRIPEDDYFLEAIEKTGYIRAKYHNMREALVSLLAKETIQTEDIRKILEKY